LSKKVIVDVENLQKCGQSSSRVIDIDIFRMTNSSRRVTANKRNMLDTLVMEDVQEMGFL
jgi:hypothetical protein